MNKYFSNVYFISRSLFLGVVFSLTFSLTMQDTIISFLIGSILGTIMIYFINTCNMKKRKIIQVILYLVFISASIMVLETFISSFFLKNTPLIIIIIPTLFLCIYASNKSDYTLFKTSKILIYVMIFLYITTSFTLLKYINIDNILPLFITKKINIFKSSIIYMVLSSVPNILIDNDKITLKEHIKCYLITSTINTLTCFIILSSLTPNVANIYSFPEYMLLKRIKIFEFIENIENILASIWYFDIFTFLTLTFKNLRKIINKKIPYYLIIGIVTIFITYFALSKYSYILFIYHNITYILIILFILLRLFNSKPNVKYK